MSTGYYNGWHYRHQRICDVICSVIKARWWFLYRDSEATGDHFRTLQELKNWVDSQSR